MLSFRFLSRSAKFASRSSAVRGAGPISAFSTVHQKSYNYQNRSQDSHKPFSVEGLFANSFEYKGGLHGATSAMTGQYAVVTEADVNSVPEGFAGEANAEFEAHGHEDTKYWMIRDSSKLVCRILDSFKAKRGSQRPAEISTSQRRINLEEYGMRSDIEWHDAVMSVEHYGKELLGKPKINFKAGGNMYMDRPSGDLVNDYMHKIKEAVPEIPDRILLTGPRGVGKSFTLNQTVVHARKNGWLVLFVPQGWSQVQEGSFIQPALLENPTFKSPITFKVTKLVTSQEELEDFDLPEKIAANEATVFDNHEMSAAALRGFLLAHAKQLRSVPIRDTAILKKYEPYRRLFQEAFDRVTSVEARVAKLPFVQIRALIEVDDGFPEIDKLDVEVLKDFKYLDFEPKTLEDLALLGVALRELSGSLFIDLVNELKALDRPDMPVLFAVDQYNNWEVPSAYSYGGRKIHAKQLAVPHALNFLSLKKADTADWKLKNGLCIAATSMRNVEGRKVDYTHHKKSVPLMVTVPQYNSQEFLAVTSFLVERKVLIPFLEKSDMATMRMFCGSNPRLVREQGPAQLFEKMITLSQEIYGEEEGDDHVTYPEDYEGPLKIRDDAQAVRHRHQEHHRRIRDGPQRVVDMGSSSESDMNDYSDGSDQDGSGDEGVPPKHRK